MIFDRGIRNHIARWSLRRSEIRLQLWESGGWSRLAHEKTCVRAVVGVRIIGPPEYSVSAIDNIFRSSNYSPSGPMQALRAIF